MQLIEKPIDISLVQWNTIQEDIWLKLVRNHLVKRNDIDIFLVFSRFFSDYYIKYHRIATYDEVLHILELD